MVSGDGGCREPLAPGDEGHELADFSGLVARSDLSFHLEIGRGGLRFRVFLLFTLMSLTVSPQFSPALDPGFVPAVLWNRAYAAKVAKDASARNLDLALVRTDGT